MILKVFSLVLKNVLPIYIRVHLMRYFNVSCMFIAKRRSFAVFVWKANVCISCKGLEKKCFCCPWSGFLWADKMDLAGKMQLGVIVIKGSRRVFSFLEWKRIEPLLYQCILIIFFFFHPILSLFFWSFPFIMLSIKMWMVYFEMGSAIFTILWS